ncbi:LacI family DNA-binding transcriptional regulator [Marinilabiliaceae bacterium ANBcel2]|nr:LacI family DNA-binding transcriptional regulator [Marinilabiliaceae bacterium ANBcel2]
MKRASLKSIAAEAGVAKTTASLVLNNKGDQYQINKETQKRILNAAKNQNYNPSYLAKTLSSGNTGTIGIICERINSWYLSNLLHHLSLELNSISLLLIPCITNQTNRVTIIEELIQRQPEAIIVTNNLDLQYIKKSSIPYYGTVISLVETPGINKVNNIYSKIESHINILLHESIRLSKKAIGFIGETDSDNRALDAYLKSYIDRFEIKTDYTELIKTDNNIADAVLTLQNKNVNAIIFESNRLLTIYLNKIKKRGLKVVQNVHLFSIGYNPRFYHSEAPIGSTSISAEEVAKRITKIAESRKRREEYEPTDITLTPLLIKNYS